MLTALSSLSLLLSGLVAFLTCYSPLTLSSVTVTKVSEPGASSDCPDISSEKCHSMQTYRKNISWSLSNHLQNRKWNELRCLKVVRVKRPEVLGLLATFIRGREVDSTTGKLSFLLIVRVNHFILKSKSVKMNVYWSVLPVREQSAKCITWKKSILYSWK